ncbi:MAG: glycosyltransferase family 4 protein [Clostridia bacterium]|nr:glycosyltransferase family 4 protein [Clostridia bacterium]
MKKITFFMLHLNFGGIEKQVTTLCNELARQNNKYDITIVSFYKINENAFYDLDSSIKVKYLLNYGPNKKEIKDAMNNFKIFRLFKELFKALKIIWLKEYLIKNEIKKVNTDIIVSSRIEFSKHIKRKDTLNISQEHSYIDTENYISKVRKSFKYIDYLVVMTEKAKKNYEQWLANEKIRPEVICIPNMVSRLNENYMSKLENKRIISVGRLHEEKNFLVLIDIFKKVFDDDPTWKLDIIGEGNQRNEIEKSIKSYNLEDKIILHGRLTEDEIIQKLQEDSIFVLTSRSESFSLVLCEAMRQGIPCISFDVDVGPREIIKDGENGFLVEYLNKEDMENKIKLLMNDERLRHDFGEKSRVQVEKFYSDKIVKQWENIFDNNKE